MLKKERMQARTGTAGPCPAGKSSTRRTEKRPLIPFAIPGRARLVRPFRPFLLRRLNRVCPKCGGLGEEKSRGRQGYNKRPGSTTGNGNEGRSRPSNRVREKICKQRKIYRRKSL